MTKGALLCAAAPMAVLAATPAMAQQTPGEPPSRLTEVQATQPLAEVRAAPPLAAGVVRLAPVRRAFNPALLQVQARPAVAFKPFAVVDPRTNKPIAPEAVIALPNGKSVPAGRFYSELNTFEQWASARGYSLHNTPKGALVNLGAVPLNQALISRQLELAPRPTSLVRLPNLLTLHSAAALARPLPVAPTAQHLAMARLTGATVSPAANDWAERVRQAGIVGAQRNGMVIDSAALARIANLRLATLPAPPVVLCTPINNSKGWGWNVGDPSTFAAHLTTSVSLTGQACKPPDMSHFNNNQSHFTAGAMVDAGGSVFGLNADVLKIQGSLSGNQGNGQVNANFGVFVLGNSIYAINQTANGHWGADNTVQTGVDFSTSIPIPLGPFDIDATIGVRGNAGFRYGIDLYPMSVNLSGGPFVNSQVYAQAGLNVVVAEAGAGANMTLINANLSLDASAGVGWLFEFYAYDNIYADANLNMLNGNVYVYAKVWYPCFDPWPDICSSQWNDNLWSWSGLHYDSVLIDQKNTIPLHW